MTMSPASRRELLRIGGALSLVGAAGSLYGLQLAAVGTAAAQVATPAYRALVCIFLFGGNDSNNVLLATDTDSWSRYQAARNTGSDPIALLPVGAAATPVGQVSPITGRTARADSPESWGGVLPITPLTANPIPAGTNATTRTFALHPMMSSLVPLFNARRLAAVANVGPLIVPTSKTQYQNQTVPLPANLMSHNDQQSTWQAGAAEGARRGWGGLLADQLLSLNGPQSVFTAVSTAGNAVFLAGQNVVQYQVTAGSTTPAIRVSGTTGTTLFGSSTGPSRLSDIIRDASGVNLFTRDYANRTVRSMDTAAALNAAFASSAVTAIPNPPQITNPITGATETNTLAQQLQTVARMIASNASLGLRRQVFFVSQGGYDTHDIQNSTQPVLLNRLATAMAYFDQVLGNIGGVDMRSSVTTFTASDFSRTFTTNGDGTDHAWGSHQLVMGGAVNGGDIYGRYPTLGVDQGTFVNPNMLRNIMIPTTAADQYSATLGRWLGASDPVLASIFPNLGNFSTPALGFL